jgi:dienelactone hydrolase
MAVEITMPKWGLSMQEGTIGTWLKSDGDAVKKGDPVVEIETEKITNLVEAPADGVLRIVHPVGSVIAVKKTIAWVAAPGEALPEAAAPSPEARKGGESSAPPPAREATVAREPAENIRAMPVARRIAKEHGLDLAAIQGSGPNGTITKEDVERALAARTAAAQLQPRPAETIRAMPAARKLAKERGVDLATIRGSGPNGAIIREDVERALAAPSAAAAQPVQKVDFFSEGHRLDGLLYTPRDLPAGERRPGVVLLVGYTYLKTMVMPDIAKALNAAGYVALVFDYRGFGDSAGPRHRLIPLEQVADARAALTFLADQPQVDPARLAVAGISLGGAHAVATAALDRRVKAAVALEPPGDGERWLRSQRRYWEWRAFQDRLAQDRSERARTGASARVDPMDIVVPDPDSRAFLEMVAGEFPQMVCELPLESAEALIEYSPEALAPRIAPRPLLLVHGEADRMVPAEESRSIAAQAGASCRLEVIPGMAHFDWVMPSSPGFRRVADLVVDFLRETLPI